MTEEASVLVQLTCCVDLQVYWPERDRIDVFDLLSDGRHVVRVGSAQSKSTKKPKSNEPNEG